MGVIHHQGIEIDLCQECGGVWLDRGEIEHMLRKKEKSNIILDVAGDALSSSDVLGVVGEIAGDVFSEVVGFIFDALSGL